MRMILCGAVVASLTHFVQPALADNFEFVVPAPVNLMLTISGNDAGGAQLFSQTVNQVEMRGSQSNYVLRIEESVIEGKLASWCVLDRTKTWADLPGSHACIDDPVEARGSYTFDAASAKPVTPPEPEKPAEAPAVPLTAAESASCVQAGLNALGFDAGAVDGKLGNGTRRAFAAYAATTDGKISDRWPLNDQTSGAICLHLARAHELDEATEALADRHADSAQVQFGVVMSHEAFGALAIIDKANSALARVETMEDFVNPVDGNRMLGASFPYRDIREAVGFCVYASPGWVIRDKAGKGYRGSCTGQFDPEMRTTGRLVISFVFERGEPG